MKMTTRIKDCTKKRRPCLYVSSWCVIAMMSMTMISVINPSVFVDGFAPSASSSSSTLFGREGTDTAATYRYDNYKRFFPSSYINDDRRRIIGPSYTNTGNNIFVARRTAKTSRIKSTTMLQSSLLATAGVALDAFWRNFPYAAAAIICGIKASGADYVAQKRQMMKKQQELEAEEEGEEGIELQQSQQLNENEDGDDVSLQKKKTSNETSVCYGKIDLQRNFAYVAYGSVYQGMSQEYIYNHLYPVFFGSGTDIKTVLIKVGFDLFIQTTLLTLPIAYMTKAIIYRYSFREAWKRYIDDVRNHGLLTKYFSLWGPVQCLTFSIVPEHFRVTFIALVSFFWLIILSTIASRTANNSNNTGGAIDIDEEECELLDGQTCKIE